MLRNWLKSSSASTTVAIACELAAVDCCMKNEFLSAVLYGGRRSRWYPVRQIICGAALFIFPPSLLPADPENPTISQSAIAAALEKVSAEVTFDPGQNIIGVNFTDAEFSDTQLTLLHDLPKLESVVISGSAFTDRGVPLVSGLKSVKQLT